MTVRPKLTTDELDRAQANLAAAVRRAGGSFPCRGASAWTQEVQTPYDSLELIAECHSCPVFIECSALARVTPARDKAHTVMAGVRYNAAGRPVDLGAQIRNQARDAALAAAVGLEGAA
ncbi:hypothetical protein [Kribbella sp. CA-247076]|uniref:hypothetical protein n=1 Tax=Kribbella sp. CA-247076 TaxID=3239941 RepID=UPI003D8F011B